MSRSSFNRPIIFSFIILVFNLLLEIFYRLYIFLFLLLFVEMVANRLDYLERLFFVWLHYIEYLLVVGQTFLDFLEVETMVVPFLRGHVG